MDIPYLDAPFMNVYPAETTEAFLDGHVSALAFFGGGALSILDDNTKLCAGPVTHDQHWGVLVREPRLRSFSAAFAGFSTLDFASAFLRFEKVRLVGLDNAGDGGSLLVLRQLEEAMPPAERRIEHDAAPFGGLAQTDAIGQRLAIGEPCVAPAQALQRCAGQGRERSAAHVAHVARQRFGLRPRANFGRFAMGTAWRGGEAAINQRNSIIGGGADFDRPDQSLALLLGQAPS